jgi:hypothetical protein
MSYDYDVVLTCKDGSIRNFRIYGQPRPNGGDIISLPVDGRVVKARIDECSQGSETSQFVDQTQAVEV